jgi:acyl dehydratase
VNEEAPSARRFHDLADLASAVGQRLGRSRWHQISQQQVNRFAEATGDHQWIHVDPARAASGPFGCPVAHGYLVLSLVPRLMSEAFEVGDLGMMVNTGVDELRFLSPVPVGAQVRLVASLVSALPRARGAVEVAIDARIDVRDHPGSACRARVGIILRPAHPTRRAMR